MAASGLTHYPVVDESGKLSGILTIEDLLAGRSRERVRESARSRVLRLRWPFSPTEPPPSDGATETAKPAEHIAALDGMIQD
jgi:CBS domain-containing protein